MFFSKDTTDRYGNAQKKFYLTQGDTATIKSTPTYNGELIDFDLISKCIFKLSDADYNELFQKEFTREDEGYSVTLESEDTSSLPIDTLFYEIEYTFVDGTVNTPNQGDFDILDQVQNRRQ